MEKENNNVSAIMAILGALILIIFVVIMMDNVNHDNASGSYYMQEKENMKATINSVKVEKNDLIIGTINDATSFCVKTTKSTPDVNSLCWKKILNNTGTMKIYNNKMYYIWIKDSNNNISNPTVIK
jgi:hypothetical protein